MEEPEAVAQVYHVAGATASGQHGDLALIRAVSARAGYPAAGDSALKPVTSYGRTATVSPRQLLDLLPLTVA